MIRDEILGMEAGRKLDILVAEEVMGWKIHCQNTAWYVYANEEFSLCEQKQADYDWSPSRSISQAWQVVEKMQKVMISKYGNDKWHVVIDTGENGRTFGEGYGKTAPEAIAKAALLAVMEANE
jgi:hypothetical protein